MRMKIVLVSLAALVSFATHGQGTILFNTRVTGQVDAPISLVETGFGGGATAQLFLVTGGATYTPLFPATTFRTTSVQASYYVVQPDVPVVVPGIPAGSPATVVLRAWFGSGSYETSTFKGQTNPITITLGGIPPGGGAPIPDAVLVGLQGFSIPEPSTMTLALLGGVALVVRRGRR